MLFNCKSDIKKINAYAYEDTLPELIAKKIEYIRSDSGKIKAVLTAPTLFQYSGDKSYFEFPDGFKVLFYDSLKTASSEMTANYGVGYDYKKLMEARDDVVIINYEKNEKLNTEILVWDQKKKMIYSKTKVRITTPEEVLYGDSLVSDESFNNYEIIKPSGTFQIDDDKN